MATKDYPVEVILSLTTGYLLCQFDRMHEMIEWVAGHPVWTHELADRGFVDKLVQRTLDQHPNLAKAETFVTPDAKLGKSAMMEYIGQYVSRARQQFGHKLAIEQGTEERTEDPLTSAERIIKQVRAN